MENEFKIGDVVKLKSGGQKMTVNAFGNQFAPKEILCAWFDEKNVHHKSGFHKDALEKVN